MRALASLGAAALLALIFAACSGDDETGGTATTTTTTTTSGGAGHGGEGGAVGGAGGEAAVGGQGGSGAQPLPLLYRDVNQVLATGQSLSVGSQGTPALSLAQPYDNLMFVDGVAATSNLTAFVPLIEGVSPARETMSSAFANLVTEMARSEVLLFQPPGEQSHDLLITLHGVGGTAYAGLKKGTQAYANGMAQLAAAVAVSQAQGLSHVVRAVTTVHGESDHIAENTNYEADLVEWQANYQTDVMAVTLQAELVPLLQTQMSSWTRYGQAQSAIPTAQLSASRNNPDRIFLVGPKYTMAYAPDGVHLTNEGYRHMGEYYAKVYRRVVLEGQPWRPVQPNSITRVGAVITAMFDVPSPPLVLDTVAVVDPGQYGFEYSDDSGAPPPIASVAVTADDTVTVTLQSEPNGNSKRLRYAYTGVPNALAGATTGPRGNLRDSDATSSLHGYALHNWCVHFDEPVP